MVHERADVSPLTGVVLALVDVYAQAARMISGMQIHGRIVGCTQESSLDSLGVQLDLLARTPPDSFPMDV